jgi:hypothetical protein
MSYRRPLAAVAIALVVSGCFHHTNEVVNAFAWSDTIADGGTIHLRNLNGEVRVRPATDGSVSVRASKHWRRGRENDVHFVTNRSGNDVYVCALWGKATRCDASGYGREHTSLLRRFLRLFSLGRTSTDMSVAFDVAVPAGVRLDASTVNGSVTANAPGAGLRASTVNGSVTVSGGAPLSAQSVNGNVTVTLDRLAAADSVSAQTVNGNVTVNVPADFQGAVELSNVNGNLGSDLPIVTTGSIERHNLRGRIGDAPRSLRLETVNGSVHVRKRS